LSTLLDVWKGEPGFCLSAMSINESRYLLAPPDGGVTFLTFSEPWICIQSLSGGNGIFRLLLYNKNNNKKNRKKMKETHRSQFS
jgi:hypothetical protein